MITTTIALKIPIEASDEDKQDAVVAVMEGVEAPSGAVSVGIWEDVHTTKDGHLHVARGGRINA